MAAGLDPRLRDLRALAADEPLLLAHQVQLAGGDADAGYLPHRPVRLQQQLELALQRDRERIDLIGRGPLGSHRLLRGKLHRLPRQRGAGTGDAHRQLGRRVDVFRTRRTGGREAPRPTGDDADADALLGRVGETLGSAVLGVDRLMPPHYRARVRITRARLRGPPHRPTNQLLHTPAPRRALYNRQSALRRIASPLPFRRRRRRTCSA
jgi:hypothetical protein